MDDVGAVPVRVQRDGMVGLEVTHGRQLLGTFTPGEDKRMFSKLVVAMEMVSHARTPLASMQSKQKTIYHVRLMQ